MNVFVNIFFALKVLYGKAVIEKHQPDHILTEGFACMYGWVFHELKTKVQNFSGRGSGQKYDSLFKSDFIAGDKCKCKI
jgi:hypothetical protein